MAAPALGIYEYQYTDDGIRLNGNSALPFIDIHKVQGLDMPTINAIESDYDSRHGGYVYARFSNSRTIVLDGTVYANANTIDTTIEALLANFHLRDEDEPFYYRGAGPAQRYIMCKPVGVNFDVDRLRSIGSCPIQFQLKAGDPLKYVDKSPLSVVSGTSYTLTNNGTAETFPVFEMEGGFTNMSIINNSTGETVTLTRATDNDDEIVIDFKKRSCYINDINCSRYLTSLGWWSLEPGVATSFRIVGTGANQMVNPDAESAYGAGYSVGSRWTGTQQSTEQKHSGTRSLKMRRNSKTAGNGNCIVPMGVTGLATGTYSAWAWMRGTNSEIKMDIQADSGTLATVALTTIPSNTWKKVQVVFTTTAVQNNLKFRFSDDGVAKPKKDKTAFFDDMGITALSASISGTVTARDGWL